MACERINFRPQVTWQMGAVQWGATASCLCRGDPQHVQPRSPTAANTPLLPPSPQVNGFISRFETTNDSGARTAVFNFYKELVEHHSYATGGSSDNEFWQQPDKLGETLAVVGGTGQAACSCCLLLGPAGCAVWQAGGDAGGGGWHGAGSSRSLCGANCLDDCGWLGPAGGTVQQGL